MQNREDRSPSDKRYSHLLRKALRDEKLSCVHLSLFAAILYSWSSNDFLNPIRVTRNSLMLLAKISSVTTFHKKIRQLTEYGYIQYKPSYNPFQGSKIHVI
jgi:hypothetical protein